MPAVQGNYAGVITEIYYLPTPLTGTIDAAALTTALTATGTVQVGNVTEIGEVTAEANIIEYSQAGETFSSSVVGQRNPGTYEFTVAASWDNAGHNTLATLSPNETHGWIVLLDQSSSNRTFIYFTGRLANSTIGGGVDEVGTIQFSIARDGAHTIAHAT